MATYTIIVPDNVTPLDVHQAVYNSITEISHDEIKVISDSKYCG